MIRIEFTEAEIQALAGLIDAGVRATGLRSVREAAVLLDKLEKAAASVMQAGIDTANDEGGTNQ